MGTHTHTATTSERAINNSDLFSNSIRYLICLNQWATLAIFSICTTYTRYMQRMKILLEQNHSRSSIDWFVASGSQSTTHHN